MSLYRNNSCANYIASVSQDDFCTERLLSSQLSPLRSTLCHTLHESLIVSRHIRKDTFLSLSSLLIPHFPDNTHINFSIKTQSLSMSLDGIFITQRRNYTVVICHLDILIVFGKNFIMSSAKKKI